MSIITINPIARADYSSETPSRGLLGRLHDRMIAAQELRAARLVKQHLANFNDRELADLGFDAGEITGIRAHAANRSPF